MSKVLIREIKDTNNPEMKCVVFEQMVPKPVTDMKSMLSFTNAGSSKFGANEQKRIAFFNFSPDMIAILGLIPGQVVPDELGATLVVHEFCEGDIIPEEVRSYYAIKDADGNNVLPTHYVPNSWMVGKGTPGETIKTKEPKMTPRTPHMGQQVLTRGGKPIYRETHLAIKEMVKEDIILTHDNAIIGSNQQMRANSGIGAAHVG